MPTFVSRDALDQLLLERFGGKVGRGLAVELLSGQQFPDVRNLYLRWSSRSILKKMKPSLKQGIMKIQTLVCSRR
jgi:hypothetical protein